MALIAVLVPTCLSAQQPVPTPSRLVNASDASGELVQWHDNFQEGWQAARESRRPMVIYITSKRCRYCDAMMRDTWRDREILKRVREGFVAIRLSPDRNATTLGRIAVPGYPTTLIGHPDGKILSHKVGYQPPHEMQRLLESADQSSH